MSEKKSEGGCFGGLMLLALIVALHYGAYELGCWVIKTNMTIQTLREQVSELQKQTGIAK